MNPTDKKFLQGYYRFHMSLKEQDTNNIKTCDTCKCGKWLELDECFECNQDITEQEKIQMFNLQSKGSNCLYYKN